MQLQNEHLAVEVLPSLGGRIQSLFDRAGDREWLWRNDALGRYACALGEEYDSNWQGGFEELFPNDAPTVVAGLQLPDHGELWSSAWDVVDVSDRSVSLRVRGPVTGVEVSKSMRLDGPDLHIAYRLANGADHDLPYLFKLHPAVAVDEDCRIELPGGRIEAVDPAFGTILPDGGPHQWPGPAGHDLSRCRAASSGLREFVYIHDVPSGWVGVADRARGRRLRLTYPLDVFPFCWLFLTYGGFRGHQTAVLEPCTTYPKELADARRAGGTTPMLAAGQVREFDVTASVGPA